MRIEELKGIGDKTASLFNRLGIYTTEDLINYFPRTYELFPDIINVSDVSVDEKCAVCCIIVGNITTKYIKGLSITSFDISDGTGQLRLTFFNMPYLKKSLKRGNRYVFYGQPIKKGSLFCIEQPGIYKPDEYLDYAKSLQPRYALTKGLTNNTITKYVKKSFDYCNNIKDELPQKYIEEYNLCDYFEAVKGIHFPADYDELNCFRNRLVFDEFLRFILSVKLLNEDNEKLENDYPMIEEAQSLRLIERLPYRLTNAQLRTWEDIKSDLCGNHCMNRLVQGDVGSGKTIIAFLAGIMTCMNGYQVALMAPTEVLAVQHYNNFKELIEKYDLNISISILTGSVTAKNKREVYSSLSDGSVSFVFGTHALIQDKVAFKNLALVITDEQHRFGVRQRENLLDKSIKNPHVLVMSATPIPRTLALILYGDLSISVIDELPNNRLPIKNCVVGPSYRETAYKFFEKEIAKGHQIYVICPMALESDSDELSDVKTYSDSLKLRFDDKVRIAYLHGKMKPREKNDIMSQFKDGNIDILVSTTVIEVGIDVPNATVIMIENAERYGLAQLHQLRGRIGRGLAQSYCIFINDNEKSENKKRLEILNNSNDGFVIAEEDLKLRGPGDLFGLRQSGEMYFKIADIYQDSVIMNHAAGAADRILKNDRNLAITLTHGAIGKVNL